MTPTLVALALVLQFTNLGDVPVAVLEAAQQEAIGMFAEIGSS